MLEELQEDHRCPRIIDRQTQQPVPLFMRAKYSNSVKAIPQVPMQINFCLLQNGLICQLSHFARISISPKIAKDEVVSPLPPRIVASNILSMCILMHYLGFVVCPNSSCKQFVQTVHVAVCCEKSSCKDISCGQFVWAVHSKSLWKQFV